MHLCSLCVKISQLVFGRTSSTQALKPRNVDRFTVINSTCCRNWHAYVQFSGEEVVFTVKYYVQSGELIRGWLLKRSMCPAVVSVNLSGYFRSVLTLSASAPCVVAG